MTAAHEKATAKRDASREDSGRNLVVAFVSPWVVAPAAFAGPVVDNRFGITSEAPERQCVNPLMDKITVPRYRYFLDLGSSADGTQDLVDARWRYAFLFRNLALGVATANGLTDALLAFRKVVDIESLRRVCRLEVIEGPAFLFVSEIARLIKRYIAPSLFPRRSPPRLYRNSAAAAHEA
jgi:hypothetical protein